MSKPEPSAAPSRRSIRLRLVGAFVLGAGVVGAFWLGFGRGGSGSGPSIDVSKGPPVVFAYLDNTHIASYLAQVQGGAATTGSLSEQVTASKNASIGSNGVSAGLAATEQSALQLSLTVNDQSRFSNLLGALDDKHFLHTINMAASDATVRSEFDPVKAGSFVELDNCTLQLPNYVTAEELARAQLARKAKGHKTVNAPYDVQSAARQAFKDRQEAQGLPSGHVPELGPGSAVQTKSFPLSQLAEANDEMAHLVRNAGEDPRVPLSSCSLGGYDPNVPDLLMPLRLGELSSAEGVLDGQVSVIGKVMLSVRGRLRMDDPGKHGYYVDLASIDQWSGAPLWTSGANGLIDEATVLGPGYLIQPLAVYK